MPKALFTPTNRAGLSISAVFPMASHISSGIDEDVFQIGECRVTCRYWTQGGDFVSKQILGCKTAVRSGQLHCTKTDAVENQVLATESVIGITGPEESVNDIALKLANILTGVLVDGHEAIVF